MTPQLFVSAMILLKISSQLLGLLEISRAFGLHLSLAVDVSRQHLAGYIPIQPLRRTAEGKKHAVEAIALNISSRRQQQGLFAAPYRALGVLPMP